MRLHQSRLMTASQGKVMAMVGAVTALITVPLAFLAPLAAAVVIAGTAIMLAAFLILDRS